MDLENSSTCSWACTCVINFNRTNQFHLTSMLGWLANISLLCFSSISLLLYILTITVIVANGHLEPFNGHFFQLFISLGLADIAHIVHLYGFALFRYWGWINFAPLFHNHSQLIASLSRKWIYFFNDYITINQYFGVLIIGVNRLCSLTEKNIWTTKTHKLSMICQWCFPLFLAAPWMFHEYSAVSVETGRSPNNYTFISINCVDVEFDRFYTKINSIIYHMLTFSNAFLYIRMIWFVTKMKRENNQVSLARQAKMKLALIGFVLFLFMLILTLFQHLQVLSYSVGQIALLEFLILIEYMLKAVFCVVNPWVLLVVSDKTRQTFIDQYFSSCYIGCFSSVEPV